MSTAESLGKMIEILLVEDSDTDARLAIEALKEAKLRNKVHHVTDGVQAMQFLRCEAEYSDAARPDLILLDLNLPKKDGRQVLAEIRDDDELRIIPVVVLTTSSEEEDILRSYQLNCNAYVTKPVDFDKFTKVVQSITHFYFSVVTLPSGG